MKKDPPRPIVVPNAVARGFTILELMVVLGVIGIIAGSVVLAYGKLLPQTQLRSATSETSVFLQKARLTAIRENRRVEITVEQETEDWAKSSENNPTGIARQWLVASLVNHVEGTETEIDRVLVSKPYGGVFLRGPADYVGGADAVTFTDDELTFFADGTASEEGGYRFSDTKSDGDAPRNVLEVYLGTLGGKPTVRKYLEPEDRPTGAGSQEFFQQSSSGGKKGGNVWVWY